MFLSFNPFEPLRAGIMAIISLVIVRYGFLEKFEPVAENFYVFIIPVEHMK